jgi:hypothetical protein
VPTPAVSSAGVYLRLERVPQHRADHRYQRILPPALMAVPCLSCSAHAPS